MLRNKANLREINEHRNVLEHVERKVGTFILEHVGEMMADTDSDLLFHRTLLGYYAEGMHANFKLNLI